MNIPYCSIRRDAPPITATPSSLLKRRQRIPTIVPSYRPVLRRHQLIVESSGPLVAVVVPPVALLPLVVIMPPVEVVVHSVALLPLATVVPRRRVARRRRVPPVAIVMPPIEGHQARSLPSLCRMSPLRLLPPEDLLSSWLIVKSSHQLRCPPLFFAVADHLPPPDALLLRRRCLHCHAAANFIDVQLLPSSLHRRRIGQVAAADRRRRRRQRAQHRRRDAWSSSSPPSAGATNRAGGGGRPETSTTSKSATPSSPKPSPPVRPPEQGSRRDRALDGDDGIGKGRQYAAPASSAKSQIMMKQQSNLPA